MKPLLNQLILFSLASYGNTGRHTISCLRSVFEIRSQRKQVTTCLVQHRALSGAEAASALRPFYFAVHPDFFGQYPYEREVNENSLKRLNGYLENLQKPGSNLARPTELTFFVRDTKENTEKKAGILHSGTV
ncbi:hypothetical protein XENOCAPTIV_022265 [Xenoophorus captivus]|uniref:DUF4460 domain-containing protein n=1 Tax=Xenoophorus captivus TaxID=1517983 RepID=A0ABV0RMV9_9TELE